MRTMSKKLVRQSSCVIRQEDYVLDRRTPQDVIGAKPSLVRTHELGQLLGHANFFRGIHTAAIVLREACCFFVCLIERFTEPVASSLCSSCEMTTANSCKHFLQIFGSNLSKKGVTFYVFLVGTHGLEDTLVRYIFDHNSMGPRNALIRKENLITFLAISSSLSSTSLLDHLG